jgi:hypothetical protein
LAGKDEVLDDLFSDETRASVSRAVTRFADALVLHHGEQTPPEYALSAA